MKLSIGPKRLQREITINEPGDGAKTIKHRVLVEFEVIGKKEADELVREGDVALLSRVLVGWGDPKKDGKGGFEDADGNALPVNDEVKLQLLDVPYVAKGLADGYFQAAYGAKLGN